MDYTNKPVSCSDSRIVKTVSLVGVFDFGFGYKKDLDFCNFNKFITLKSNFRITIKVERLKIYRIYFKNR